MDKTIIVDGVEYVRTDSVERWYPIESAPKDGSWMMGKADNRISINYWENCYGGEWHTGQDTGGMSRYPITWEPTHWRPMTEEERRPYLTYLVYE